MTASRTYFGLTLLTFTVCFVLELVIGPDVAHAQVSPSATPNAGDVSDDSQSELQDVAVNENDAAQENDNVPASDPFANVVGLERLQKVLELDAEHRWAMLPTISPRGVGATDRAEMVRLLSEQLDHDYPDVRARAAEVLALFEADAAAAIPKLMEHVGDADQLVSLQPVWTSVSKTLAAIGAEHALDPLMQELPDSLKMQIEKQDGEYVADWSDPNRFLGITGAISGMEMAASSTAPTFIEILANGPENRRWAAMFTLSKFGDAALPAIPLYIENLDHANFNLKVIACRALAELGPASKAAVPKLLELTEKPNVLSTRTHAAMCLGAIGPVEGVDLIQLFTDMIEEPNAFSQERGLIALGRLGPHARNTERFVLDLLANEEFSQRPEAARALWQITGKSEKTLEILTAHIDDPTFDSRCYNVLKDMGPDAAPLAEVIASKLQTDDQSLRLELIEVLESMGEVKTFADAIRGALENAAPDTALKIDKVLAKIDGE